MFGLAFTPRPQPWMPIGGASTRAIAFVGGASATATTSATITLSLAGTLTGGLASSPSAGDVVIAACLSPTTTDRALRVTGDDTWTDYVEVGELYADDARDTNLSVAWKRMGATPDTQVKSDSFASGGTYGQVFGASVWRYLNAVLPIAAAFGQKIEANTQWPTPEAVTPTIAGSVGLIVSGSASTPGHVYQPAFSGWTTRLFGVRDATSGSGKLLMASAPWSSSGAMTPPRITDGDSDSANGSCASFTLILLPQ